MPWRATRTFGLLLALSLLAAWEPAHAETEVYRPRHRLAAELLTLVETALGADGHAVVDPGSNALVMVGTPEALAAARELLDQVDRALRNVEVRYAQKSRAELEAAGLEVRWRTEAGPVRFGSVARGRPGAELRIFARDEDRHANRAGRLRVLEGQTGRIETGTLVAYETGGPWHRHTELLEATSGFEVTPRILSDGRVRLALRPYDARPTAEGQLAIQSSETELVLEPGETVVVGGLTRDATRRAHPTLSGASRAQGREALLLLIRVETP